MTQCLAATVKVARRAPYVFSYEAFMFGYTWTGRPLWIQQARRYLRNQGKSRIPCRYSVQGWKKHHLMDNKEEEQAIEAAISAGGLDLALKLGYEAKLRRAYVNQSCIRMEDNQAARLRTILASAAWSPDSLVGVFLICKFDAVGVPSSWHIR
jgi:hypothetical protein